jgi:hypothetical protein
MTRGSKSMPKGVYLASLNLNTLGTRFPGKVSNQFQKNMAAIHTLKPPTTKK